MRLKRGVNARSTVMSTDVDNLRDGTEKPSPKNVAARNFHRGEGNSRVSDYFTSKPKSKDRINLEHPYHEDTDDLTKCKVCSRPCKICRKRFVKPITGGRVYICSDCEETITKEAKK